MPDSSFQGLMARRQWLAASVLVAMIALLFMGQAEAQGPLFLVSSTSAPVIAAGGSEVLGTIALSAATGCGGNADGQCVSTPADVNVFFEGTAIDNSLATGITVGEIIGGVTATAPTVGTLITGVVTVTNTPQGGLLSFGIKGGVDLAVGDMLVINGVRGRIVASPASQPGTLINALFSMSGIAPGTLTPTELTVARSAVGLEYVSVGPTPGVAEGLTITFREAFSAVFVQYVATAQSGLPANPRPAFGASNNTQLHFRVSGLAGRVQWPAKSPSQLAGSTGVIGGGSELQLVSQNFDGSEATYEFATADQAQSDRTQESFAIAVTLCGSGTLSLQGQLFPGLSGRPGFDDPLLPSPAASANVFLPACVPSPIVKVSGDNQLGAVGATLPQPLVVKVQDGNGNPVQGITVNFAAATGGASVLPASMVTNAQGQAQTLATLGPATGVHAFTAAVGQLGVLFVATAVPAPFPALPVTKFVPYFVVGGGFLTRIAILNLAGQANPVQVNFLTPAGDLVRSQTQTIPANGRFDVSRSEADRFGQLTTQWAVVGSTLPVAVNVFLDAKLSTSGTLLTATSFPAVEPLTAFTLPFAFAPAAGQTSALTAGLALANISANLNPVELRLVDGGGVVRATDNVTLPPYGQTAFVLAERPAFAAALQARAQFFGSVVVTARAPIAATDVGNESGQFFSVPEFRPAGCFQWPFAPFQSAILPYIAVGGGWATRITITNLCQIQNNVQVEVFDPAGNPAASFLGPNVTLGPLETAVFSSAEADRSRTLGARWVRITSQVGVGVQMLLNFVPTPGQPPASAVGASQSSPMTRFTLPVDFAAGQSTTSTVGLGLTNISSSAGNIVLRLVDSQGSTVAEETSISLPPQGQIAFVVSDLPAFRILLQPLAEFRGSLLVITSQATTVLAVASDSGRAFALPVFVLPGGG